MSWKNREEVQAFIEETFRSLLEKRLISMQAEEMTCDEILRHVSMLGHDLSRAISHTSVKDDLIVESSWISQEEASVKVFSVEFGDYFELTVEWNEKFRLDWWERKKLEDKLRRKAEQSA